MRPDSDSPSQARPTNLTLPGEAPLEGPPAQPRTIQPRRFERKAFRIPVHIQQGSQQTTGETADFTPGGLRLLCRDVTALAPGAALNLTLQFDKTCHLLAAGQVAYRLAPSADGMHTLGIRFAGLRDWEQTIVLSALKELEASDRSRQASLIALRVSENSLAREATELTSSTLDRTVLPPRYKELDFAPQSVEARREWLVHKTGVPLTHIALMSEPPQNFRGNIENLIGVSHVPLGIAGPIRVNGEDARGLFYVPLATTEGAITYTYTRGMHLVTAAGGVTTHVLRDEIHISPIFVFKNLEAAKSFTGWLADHFEQIKSEAEKTTRHGRLLRLEPHLFDRAVVVKFCYITGDAMGLNMINIATEAACDWIVPQVRPEEFFLRSNFSSVKKISAHNYSVAGFGKTVIAEVTIPRRLLKRFFAVSPETMARYCHLAFVSSVHAGMVGMNGHTANGLAALFIACGQDVANVVDSQASVSSCEVTAQGDLYVSIKIPNLVVGTVGGGTSLGSQRECLEILGCYGNGKARKFAEIVAATVLAGEIAVAAAICTGTFVTAHKKYGRKPKEPSSSPAL